MRGLLFTTILTVLIAVSCSQSFTEKINSENTFFEAIETNTQWPSYRGLFASGYMKNTHLPDSFNVETGYNVKWNIEIPGMGLSCPVIWDDQVFITTAISRQDKEGYLPGMYGDIAPVEDSSEHVWMLYSIDKRSGEIDWEYELYKGIPSVKRHPKSSHANTTVATDGKHVVVFLGTEGLYCFDMNGELLWETDFGLIMSAWHIVESAEWEFCSSPVIFQDKLIIQADALNQAFVAVLDLESGKISWKKERDEIPGWCTPNIYFDGEKPRVVVNGYKHRGAYDLETGAEVWKMAGGGDIPIPTPVVWKDLIFFNSAHGRHAPLMAVKNSVEGEVAYAETDSTYGEDFAWFYDREGSYMTSVVVYDSLLYRFRWNGNLSCFDARTGEKYYSESVKPYSFIAAPVIADDRIYLVAEEGRLYVVKTGKEYELLNEISLGEISLVSPGLVQDMIIFRTAGRLIAVGE
ncbi:PQQ-binding-like beta-propeller repeat protein [Bacteroidota bacterium]